MRFKNRQCKWCCRITPVTNVSILDFCSNSSCVIITQDLLIPILAFNSKLVGGLSFLAPFSLFSLQVVINKQFFDAISELKPVEDK